MTELDRSFLVQRLEAPFESEGLLGEAANAFSFGGGRKNGGLSDDAMALIKDIWRFDYMGAAEFEWGAVPEALQKVAKAKLTSFELKIPKADIKESWDGKFKAEKDGTVYGICAKGTEDEVQSRIKEWAKGEEDLKERTMLADALLPKREHFDVCGWLELENGFLFFTDKDMFDKTATLFGVNT